MRITALLNWYEEPAPWLAETTASVARVCDHIVAVDGPYAHFPGSVDRPTSSPEQAETILRTAAGAGIGATVHTPREPWWGGEVEKRNHLIQLGLQTQADWLLSIDADEYLTHLPSGLEEKLEGYDVAEVMLWDRAWNSHSLIRRMYRCQPGLQVIQAHYVVVAGDKILSGNPDVHKLETPGQVWDLRLEHRRHERSAERLALKQEYDMARNELELEKVSAL